MTKESRMYKSMTLTACGLLVLTAQTEEKRGKRDANSLKGPYTIPKGEREGKALPADHFKGSVVTFTETKIFGTDKDKKEYVPFRDFASSLPLFSSVWAVRTR